MKGKPNHNFAVEALCQEYEANGWRVIRHNERLPTYIAIKDSKLYGIVIVVQRFNKHGKWKAKVPFSTYKRRYRCLDGLHACTVRMPGGEPNASREQTRQFIERNGWRVIYKGRKTPDALAIKDNQVWALEVLIAQPHSPLQKYTVAAKKASYGMFDGCDVRVCT